MPKTIKPENSIYECASEIVEWWQRTLANSPESINEYILKRKPANEIYADVLGVSRFLYLSLSDVATRYEHVKDIEFNDDFIKEDVKFLAISMLSPYFRDPAALTSARKTYSKHSSDYKFERGLLLDASCDPNNNDVYAALLVYFEDFVATISI